MRRHAQRGHPQARLDLASPSRASPLSCKVTALFGHRRHTHELGDLALAQLTELGHVRQQAPRCHARDALELAHQLAQRAHLLVSIHQRLDALVERISPDFEISNALVLRLLDPGIGLFLALRFEARDVLAKLEAKVHQGHQLALSLRAQDLLVLSANAGHAREHPCVELIGLLDGADADRESASALGLEASAGEVVLEEEGAECVLVAAAGLEDGVLDMMLEEPCFQEREALVIEGENAKGPVVVHEVLCDMDMEGVLGDVDAGKLRSG